MICSHGPHENPMRYHDFNITGVLCSLNPTKKSWGMDGPHGNPIQKNHGNTMKYHDFNIMAIQRSLNPIKTSWEIYVPHGNPIQKISSCGN